MATEIQEYKFKRKNNGPQHKFPLLRLLLIAFVALLVYWSGLLTKIANALPLPQKETQTTISWDAQCKKFAGVPTQISDSLVQCGWVVKDSNLYTLPHVFLRYLSSQRVVDEAKIYWVSNVKDYSKPLVIYYENGSTEFFYQVMRSDSSYVWVRKNINETSENNSLLSEDGCRYPGVCPHVPMDGPALSIIEGFDFEGQESLIAADRFRGQGDAPVYAVLPGRVLNLGKDSLGYFIELHHGNNIFSKTSGLGFLNDELKIGDKVEVDEPIGRLPPSDSSVFYLSLRENGLFIRWQHFYEKAYPLTPAEIQNFENSVSALFEGLQK